MDFTGCDHHNGHDNDNLDHDNHDNYDHDCRSEADDHDHAPGVPWRARANGWPISEEEWGRPPQTLGQDMVELVRDVEHAVGKLLELPVAEAGAADDDGVDLVEQAIERLARTLRAADTVLGRFAHATIVNELHRRAGGRATPRTYLLRLLNLTNAESKHLLTLRDTLHPEPDPDPPDDADDEEISARDGLQDRREDIAAVMGDAAARGHFPIARARELRSILAGFDGQKAGMMEDAAETIAGKLDRTPANLFRSMCISSAEPHLRKRKNPERSAVSQAYVTVHRPDLNGLCRIEGKLPAPTAAVFHALVHYNAAPGSFIELPEGVTDPRTAPQRRVHALHHILMNGLAGNVGAGGGGTSAGGGGANTGGAADGRGAQPPGGKSRRNRLKERDDGTGLLRWIGSDSPWWDPERCPYVRDLFSGEARPLARPMPGVASIVVAIRAKDFDDELRRMAEPRGDGREAAGAGPPEHPGRTGGAPSDGTEDGDGTRQGVDTERGGVTEQGDGRGGGWRRFPTNTGIDLTLPELIGLGAHRYGWLALLEDITGRPLDLGRTRRVADLFQRVALLAGETVCSYPGCEKPADDCEAHHIDPWLQGGTTDIGNLTLRCPEHHRENDDEGRGDASGRATHPRDTGRAGHAMPGKAPKFNDSPAARKSPGWAGTWWADYQANRREMSEAGVRLWP